MSNRKSVHLFVAFALVLILLPSFTMGTAVGKKPARPGKPVETWDITIRIGIGELKGENEPEDIVLISSTHVDIDGYYLFAEDVPCSGRLWDQPMKKGKNPNRNNLLSAQVDLIKDWGDDCGIYQLPDALNAFFLENQVTNGNLSQVSIRHNVFPVGDGMDYWTFAIHWVINPDPIDYQFYQLDVWTDEDYDAEGTLSEEEGWIIPFDGAEFMLYSGWDNDGDGVPDVIDLTGFLSFTIGITRTLHVPST